MSTLQDHHEGDDWATEGWTGEQDSVAAVALGVCLAIAALLFLFVAAGMLRA